MLVTIYKSAKRVVLGLMLLLAGLAGVVTVDVDNDGDIETPAVVIETPMVAPVEKLVFSIRSESMLHSGPAERTAAAPKIAASLTEETASTPAPTTFPLVVPLRT